MVPLVCAAGVATAADADADADAPRHVERAERVQAARAWVHHSKQHYMSCVQRNPQTQSSQELDGAPP